MERREFLETALLGGTWLLANAARSDAAPDNHPSASGGNYKLTVLHRTPDKASGRLCSLFRDHQEIVVELTDEKPDAFCSEGWADILPCIREVAQGKADSSVCGCTGPSPVYFRIERLNG